MTKMSVSWQEVAEVRQKLLQAIDFKRVKKGEVAGLRRR